MRFVISLLMLAVANSFFFRFGFKNSRGSLASVSMSAALSSNKKIVDAIEKNKVAIFSKTYCPFCSKAKDIFREINQPFEVLELDEMTDGTEIQSELARITGQSTVPNIFINGKHLGGCDSTVAARKSGKLAELLAAPRS